MVQMAVTPEPQVGFGQAWACWKAGSQAHIKGPEKMIIKFTLYGENQVVPSGALVVFCAKPCIKF